MFWLISYLHFEMGVVMRRMAAERPPLSFSKTHFAGWPYSTLLPGPWAAADGLCWHTSRESHPSEDLSELPPLRDPATRWFPNVMDYSDLKQGCGWTGVPLCPFPVMAAPGAARFLQAAVTRSYRTGLYARPIMIIRWDLLIMSVYHGAAPESALALRAGKGGCY